MGLQDFDPSLRPISLDGVTPLKGPSLDADIAPVNPVDVKVIGIGKNISGFVQVQGYIEGKGPVDFYIATPAGT